ncbi:MAG: methyltransferase domain-containing protein [Synechococcales cyanobacterium]
MIKLDVGCGDQKRPGYLGMDIVALPGVDILHDMNVTPWPLEADSVSEVVFDDVLEHSKNFLGILSELYRVCHNQATIKVSAPHFSSDSMYCDPTHTTFFSSRTFNYFDKSLNYKHSYYLKDVNFKIEMNHISFREYFTHSGQRPWLNPVKWIGLEWLINCSRGTQRIYEHFFAWILPASELYFELRVIK